MKNITEQYENGLQHALSDPVEAAEYLNAALEDGSPEVFLMALKDVAATKGISKIAKKAEPDGENLYKILSAPPPNLKTLNTVLRSVGLKLAVTVENSTK